MLSVTFKSPIVIDEKNLGALLSLAGVAAVVEPYSEAKRPGRKPAVAAAPAEAPAPEAGQQASPSEPAVVKPAGKKRGRKSAAEKAAEAAAGTEAPAEPAAGDGAAAGTDDLLARFSALIDSDFEGAKGILDKLGVERFSDLPESEYPAFDAALKELGA